MKTFETNKAVVKAPMREQDDATVPAKPGD